MNTRSLLIRALPRCARGSSQVVLMLALTLFAACPTIAAPPEQSRVADPDPAARTQPSPLEHSDASHPRPPVPTQGAEIHFAADTHLVTVRTPLGDPQAEWLTNAHPESFIVYENGLRQPIVHVAAEHIPISLGILLEHGGRYHALNEILGDNVAAAAKELLDETAADDKVAIWKYAEDVETVSGWSRATDGLRHTFIDLPPPAFSELNFHDALITTLPKIQAMPGRKALVLISSGCDTFSRASFADALAATRNAGVPIYVINLGPLLRAALPPDASETGPYASMNWNRAESELRKLARASGGRMYSPDSRSDLTGVYDELLANLRIQYVIQYKSPASVDLERPRTVRVEVVDSNGETPTLSAQPGAKAAGARLVVKAAYVPKLDSPGDASPSASTSDAIPATPPAS